MGKEKSPRRVGDKEALSVGTQIRGSAQKLNLVAGLIQFSGGDVIFWLAYGLQSGLASQGADV